MLFDLRARGRRRTVQLVYLGLAILMGGGLILFGIGGATSGGLLDAFTGGGGGSGSNVYEQQVKQAQAQTRAHPSQPAAWAQLARAEYLVASTQASAGQKPTRALQGAAAAWQRYLSLNPRNPDPNVASLMVRVYGQGGLNQLGNAVDAEQIYAQAHPSTNVYKQLAALAYAAGQTRTGDLAADKAVALAPKSERSAVRQQLAQIKAQAAQQATSSSSSSGAATP